MRSQLVKQESQLGTYPAVPANYHQVLAQEGSRCDVAWYLSPEAEGPYQPVVEDLRYLQWV